MGTYRSKEEILGADAMRQLESQVMLRIMDMRWMNHLQAMDYLKTRIGLRAFGQRDPLAEDKEEAHRAFSSSRLRCNEDFLRTLLRLRIAAPVEQEESSPLDGKVSYLARGRSFRKNTIAGRGVRPTQATAGQSPKPAATAKPLKRIAKMKIPDPYVNVKPNDPARVEAGRSSKSATASIGDIIAPPRGAAR